MSSRRIGLVFSAVTFVAGFFLGGVLEPGAIVGAQSDKRVFEIRTYTAAEGKLDALNARFRNHTTKLFQKNGITNIGYWTPQDAPLSQNTLIYILAHPSREAAKENWAKFQKDPDWQKARAESEVQGRIVAKVESVFVNPTDYSPMK
jgi:hypothetical protein